MDVCETGMDLGTRHDTPLEVQHPDGTALRGPGRSAADQWEVGRRHITRGCDDDCRPGTASVVQIGLESHRAYSHGVEVEWSVNHARALGLAAPGWLAGEVHSWCPGCPPWLPIARFFLADLYVLRRTPSHDKVHHDNALDQLVVQGPANRARPTQYCVVVAQYTHSHEPGSPAACAQLASS